MVTEKGTVLGRLTDLIFLTQPQPVVTKLVVSGTQNTLYLMPVSYVTAINAIVTVADAYALESLAHDELYVAKNVLDQQIIDIRGNKVVRVNDVAIANLPAQTGKTQLLVAGVDIGIVGILRWFGLDETFGRVLRLLGVTITSQFLSWADIQPLALSRGHVALKKEEKKLAKLRPEDLADHLETMSIRNVTKVLDVMDEALATSVVENLNLSYQQSLFKQFAPERSALLIEPMAPEEAADILLSLKEQRRLSIMDRLSPAKQAEVNELIALSGTPIGGLITKNFFTAKPSETAGRIIARIRRETTADKPVYYVYAISAAGQLVGVVNMHELLIASSDAPLYRFMNTSLIVLHMTTPMEIAVRRMLKYRLNGLPVIDASKHLLGVVLVDDLAEAILKKL